MVYSFVIEPTAYYAFADEAEQIDKCKEWDLLSEKATKNKIFYYKGNGLKEACSIVGYVDHMTAVIEFANKQKHCIHHSYLKEMQAANYGQRYVSAADPDEAGGDRDVAAAESVTDETLLEANGIAAVAAEQGADPVPEPVSNDARPAAVILAEPPAAPAPAKARSGAKPKKAQLPEEKVKLIATIKEFTTVPNHFADNDDEVIIYEAVAIVDPETELGEAWSSHSATLKKLELAVGDKLSFEAKIVAKKLAKHPIPYKINNPAKIAKELG